MTVKWRTIESAPRETEVLTFRSSGLMAVAINTEEFGWIVTDGASLINVTHWMPLPEPPEPQP